MRWSILCRECAHLEEPSTEDESCGEPDWDELSMSINRQELEAELEAEELSMQKAEEEALGCYEPDWEELSLQKAEEERDRMEDEIDRMIDRPLTGSAKRR